MRATIGSDYFYFFCPKCPDKYIMRILDHGLHDAEKDSRIRLADNQKKSQLTLWAGYLLTILF